MSDPAAVVAVRPGAGARRRLRRLIRGTRQARKDFERFNRALERVADTDAVEDRAAALQRLAAVRSAQAELRREVIAVPGVGSAGHDIVAALDQLDSPFAAFAAFLTVGATADGLAFARRGAALIARGRRGLSEAMEALR